MVSWKELLVRLAEFYSMSTVCLRSDRLILRELTASDVTEDYVSWLNDPLINRYLESRFITHDLVSVTSFVDEMIGKDEEFFFWCFL